MILKSKLATALARSTYTEDPFGLLKRLKYTVLSQFAINVAFCNKKT